MWCGGALLKQGRGTSLITVVLCHEILSVGTAELGVEDEDLQRHDRVFCTKICTLSAVVLLEKFILKRLGHVREKNAS